VTAKSNVSLSRCALKWVGIGVGIFVVGYAFFIAGVTWFGDYISEGILQSEKLEGNVLVALSDEPEVKQALISGCHSAQVYMSVVKSLIASGKLAEARSGTRMHMPTGNQDPDVVIVTIAEGMLAGRKVDVCRDQFTLLHPPL